jgi:hypothetical protein
MKQSIWREFILFLWSGWEKLFALALHIQEVEPGNLVRLNIKQYHGPTITLKDGTEIRPGETLGELHLDNKELFKLQQNCSNRVKAVMTVKKALKRDLHRLAELMLQQKIATGVKAFYGITLFHQGALLLGFEVRDFRSSFLSTCFCIGQMLLLVAYHPSGIKRLKQGHQALGSKEIWISRTALLRDFTTRQQCSLPAGTSATKPGRPS